MDTQQNPSYNSEQSIAGMELISTLEGHNGTIYSITWSPDGQILGTGATDSTICLWEAESGKSIQTISHKSVVSIITWSPDSRFIASGLWDHVIHLWERQTSELYCLLEHEGVVSSLAWAPNGTLLATGTSDRTISLWNIQTCARQRFLEGHEDGVISLAWSPDGAMLASGSDDRTIRLWDPETGNVYGTLKGHHGEVISLIWAPDGRMLCSGAIDETIHLWDIQSGDLRWEFEGYYGNADTIAWSSDGRMLALGAWNETIHLINPDTGREEKVLGGHTDRILGIRFSPDGRLLASKCKDNTVRIWRCDTLECVTVFNEPDSPVFGGLAFHLQEPTLATRGGGGCLIHVWRLDYSQLLPEPVKSDQPGKSDDDFLLVSHTRDFMTGLEISEEPPVDIPEKMVPEAVPAGFELLQTLSGHGGVICDASWSPDGKLIASGAADHKIYVWNGESGEQLCQFEGHSDMIDSIAWSPDGCILASGSADHTIGLWESESGVLLNRLKGHYDGVISVSWAPSGQILASSSRDKTVRLWDKESGELLRTLEGHDGAVYAADWSPDGRILASASFDQTIRLWDDRNGELLRVLDGQGGAVTSIDWSPDSSILASGFVDNTVHLWDVRTGRQLVVLKGHTDSILCIRFSYDGRLLASKSYDSTVRLWRCDTGALLAILIEPAAVMDFSGLAFHPTAPVLATRGENDLSIRIWKLDEHMLLPDDVKSVIAQGVIDLREQAEDSGGERHQLAREKSPPGFELLHVFRGVEEVISGMTWSPDGQMLATASADHRVRIWDAQNGELIRTLEGHEDWVSSVTWSPDGELIGSGAFDRTVRVWDAQNGILLRTLEGHRNDVSSVCWSPDGQILASGARDQTIRLWDRQSGELLHTFEGHRGPVYDIEWFPDGNTLVSASFDKTLRIWDVERGIPRLMLRGHAGPITCVALSPDGLTLASGSHDNTIRLWHAETGRLVSILENHTDTVFDVQFSPDGLLIASKAFDNTVRLWRYDSGDPVAILGETGDVLNFAGLAFHPRLPLLATRGEGDRIVRIWRLDYSALLGAGALANIQPTPEPKTIPVSKPQEDIRSEHIAPEQEIPIPEEESPAGLEILHKLSGHEGLITELAWSPDGELLASGSQDKTIGLWNGWSGEFQGRLEGHGEAITSICWSPDGLTVASGSSDGVVRLWDVQSKALLQAFEGHTDGVLSVAWAPDGWMLASGSDDQTVRLWDTRSGELLWTFEGHHATVTSVVWSPDSRKLASASFDNTIRVWDAERGVLLHTIEGHGGAIASIAWSPDGKTLATGSLDNTVRLWDAENGQQISILESHTDIVLVVSFSPDGRLLASKSDDGTVRIWRGDSGQPLAVLNEPTDVMNFGGLAFHPEAPMLATRGEGDTVIRVWQIDHEALFAAAPQFEARYYRNAKVVLVGDSGTGKSGLSLVLTEQPWEPTGSTHGRHVWMFDSHETVLPTGQRETRETLLWDLAGQPDYRLIHQLYLNEVVVALVVFEASSTTEAFAGVRHWSRALHQACRLQSNATMPLKKFLVAGRCDRSGLQISRERIDALLEKFEFDGFFETSAKEGWQIPELIAAMKEAIDWDTLPKVSSSELFQTIKQFLVRQKQAELLLSSSNDLYRTFCEVSPESAADPHLRPKFDTCVSRVENRDLIRRLSFGGYVLLQPELLDAYASALINAARSQPDGLGFVSEEDALSGQFNMSQDERVADPEQEKLLLIATVEELLRHELILNEVTDSGVAHLVFPSQITREIPDDIQLPDETVIFSFEGPLLNIYATLTTRLSQSGLFTKKDHWKNVATYTTPEDKLCGVSLRELDEGQGELGLLFEESIEEATQYQFEDYVVAHLKRLALANTVQRRQVVVCEECGELIPDSMVQRLRERDRTTMSCPICEHSITLLDREDRRITVDTHTLAKMEQAADAKRERDTAAMILKGKTEAGDFDVFLCHNSKDKVAVKAIGETLKERGILPWLDEWEFRPGLPWQKTLESQIDHIKSAAVFIGSQGIGPWQDMEIDAFLRKFVSRRCPVIPVILEGCEGIPKLPVFLEGMMWVDFRKPEPDPMEQLLWGITGEKKIV